MISLKKRALQQSRLHSSNITGSSVSSLPKIPHCSPQYEVRAVISFPMWLCNLSVQLSIIGLVSFYPHQLPNTTQVSIYRDQDHLLMELISKCYQTYHTINNFKNTMHFTPSRHINIYLGLIEPIQNRKNICLTSMCNVCYKHSLRARIKHISKYFL